MGSAKTQKDNTLSLQLNHTPLSLKKHTSLTAMGLLTFTAHELKTPLSTINLNISLLKSLILKEKWNTKHAQLEVLQLLDILKEESLWMQKFISETLDVCIAEGKPLVKKQNISWKLLLEDLADRLKEPARLHKTGLNLVYRGRKTLLPKIKIPANKLLLTQALHNLLINAIEHSAPQSQIKILWTAKKEKIEMEITNPLSQNQSAPLHIYSQTTKPVLKNTGLGLLLSKKFISLHGGSLKIKKPKKADGEFKVHLCLPIAKK